MSSHVEEHCSGSSVVFIPLLQLRLPIKQFGDPEGHSGLVFFPGFLAFASLAAQRINSNALNPLY